MHRLHIIIFYLLVLDCSKGIAQKARHNFSNSKDDTLFKKEKSLLLFSSHFQPSFQTDYSFSKAFHAVKRPMFCQLEDGLHKRFNVWILLRAGSDADYRKLMTAEK